MTEFQVIRPEQPKLVADGPEEIFAAVGVPGRPGESVDLVVKAGRIERFERRSQKPPVWTLLPPLADLHVHSNRAFTIGPTQPSSLEHAIHMAQDMYLHFSEADYARQAERLFAQAVDKGTTRLRTHADVNLVASLKAVRGTLAARARFADALDVDVVAFASSSSDPVDPSVRALLRDGCALGAELIGAVPAYYADPKASIDALLDLAVALDVCVDLHLDEHLDVARSCSRFLAESTCARGLNGRVTLSHGCTISVLDHVERQRVAECLARAQITVIALPATNLYLQDRGAATPAQRGLTAVKELAAAGVEVRFASDNVQDAFFPYGTADLLDIAYLAALAAQIDDMGLLIRGICGGRDDVTVGSEASFVLIRGSSLAEVLAERTGDRLVVKRGALANPTPKLSTP